MFQEGADPEVQRAFHDIVRSTAGPYGRFDSAAAKQLGELVKAVFTVGGTAALVAAWDPRHDREP